MKYRIRVTGDHIVRGQRRRPTLSPVALALKEVAKGANGETIEWRIGPGYAYRPVFAGAGTMVKFRLDQDVWQRVNFYDRTGYMEPFDFTFDLRTDGTKPPAPKPLHIRLWEHANFLRAMRTGAR